MSAIRLKRIKPLMEQLIKFFILVHFKLLTKKFDETILNVFSMKNINMLNVIKILLNLKIGRENKFITCYIIL